MILTIVCAAVYGFAWDMRHVHADEGGETLQPFDPPLASLDSSML